MVKKIKKRLTSVTLLCILNPDRVRDKKTKGGIMKAINIENGKIFTRDGRKLQCSCKGRGITNAPQFEYKNNEAVCPCCGKHKEVAYYTNDEISESQTYAFSRNQPSQGWFIGYLV